MDIKKACRICTKEHKTTSPIFSQDTNLLNKIKKVCGELVIEPDDRLPNIICIDCIHVLEIAYNFKLLIIQSEQIFKEILSTECSIKEDVNDSLTSSKIVDDSDIIHCKHCKNIFINKYTYRRHIYLKHTNADEQKRYKCYGCDKSFQTKWNRSFHEQNCKNISEKTPYECNKCRQSFNSRKDFDTHLETHKSSKCTENNHHCDICLKIFKSKPSLFQHRQLHDSNQQFVCEVCGHSFKRKDYLKVHMASHVDMKTHYCPHCVYRSNRRSSLNIHIRTHLKHSTRLHTCDLCGYNSFTKSNLLAHQRRHQALKPYECKVCEKTFRYSKSLNEHISVTHEGLNNCFCCSKCNATYSRKRGLVQHMNKKHIQF